MSNFNSIGGGDLSLFDELKNTLLKNSKYSEQNTENPKLLRNVVIEDALNMNKELLHILLSNPKLKNHFFTDVDGVLVFDKNKFTWTIENKEFLPDSYTRFKQKIGLIDSNERFISSNNDVVLSFPYKDCVLEGGQTKDDQKRSEIFFNETLAPEEVDCLLAPKVFTNIKKYTKDGEEPVSSISLSDNLLIKGNNLLSLSSLLKRYQNKVKLIYIDPPYNTGNDSFGYNDSFNHSTWLVFMKNRLIQARKLLREDGSIAISIDNYELAYLLVLLDEIFGKENRKNIITVRRASASGAKVINPGVVNVVEYIVIYSKNTNYWKPNRVYAKKKFDSRYNSFIKNIYEPYESWQFSTVLDEWARSTNIKKSQLKKHFFSNYEKELDNFRTKNADKICRFAALDDSSISKEAREFKQKSLNNPNKILYMAREKQKPYFFLNGQVVLFAKDRLSEIDGKLTFSQPLTDIWDDVLPNDLSREGNVEFKKGKKPEKLIGRLIDLCTNEQDLILDFFAGSGTTGAVALKKNRKFIICEQMSYIGDVTVTRLNNVLAMDKAGITKETSWAGGGNFVYCELKDLNQTYIKQIQNAGSDPKLIELYNKISKSKFINSKVKPSNIESNVSDFESLSTESKRKLLIQLLDLNMLYVNYSDIDDEEYKVSDGDKSFNRSFYGD